MAGQGRRGEGGGDGIGVIGGADEGLDGVDRGEGASSAVVVITRQRSCLKWRVAPTTSAVGKRCKTPKITRLFYIKKNLKYY